MSTLCDSLARSPRKVFFCSFNNARCHFMCASLLFSLQVLVHSLLSSSLGSPIGTIGGFDGFNARGIHLITPTVLTIKYKVQKLRLVYALGDL